MQKTNKSKSNYDVAIIGGGPAGIMAAGTAGSLGLKAVLIEKNKELGKKLLLTGGGRCNLSNAEFDLRKLAKNYNNGEFLFHIFSEFGPKETINFFEKIGVKIKIEKNQRVFPESNDAEEILNALLKYLKNNNVEIILNSEIVDVNFKNRKINKLILKNGEIKAKKYILAAGGKSYFSTGSNGFGYKIAEKLGHTIINPMPALSPIGLKESWIKDLQGIILKNIKITVFKNNKKILSEDGEILFTHFGISGPAVLNISGKIGKLLENGETNICIDLFPLLNHEEVLKSFKELLEKYPKQTIKNILSEFVPERLAVALLEIACIDKNKIANNMPKTEKEIMAKTLKNFKTTVKNVFGFESAMVTQGGISLKEIDHKTMKSKIIDNLYFAGEIIDVDGKSGGFNLQMCWSTGYTAGKNTK